MWLITVQWGARVAQ